MKPLRLFLSLGTVVFIVSAGLILFVLRSGSPDTAWQKHLDDFSQADSRLLHGDPDKVIMIWSPQPNWTANVTVDLERKTMLGGAGNGVSFSAPYPDARREGNPLTDEQILEIRQALSQLPEGIQVDAHSGFFHDFRVAYFQNGIRKIRHYPSARLPRSLKEMGESLHLWLPEQAQE